MKRTHDNTTKCECSDPGCTCKGKCTKPATQKLARTDMTPGVYDILFCDDCTEDALDSGLFDVKPLRK